MMKHTILELTEKTGYTFIIYEAGNKEEIHMSLLQDMKKHKNLTEREQDIRRFIMEHPEKIEEMSSRELGHATFTSAAW